MKKCVCGHLQSLHRDGEGECSHETADWLCDCQQFCERPKR